MGRIWNAANRAEGYKLGRKEGGLVIVIDVIVWTSRTVFRFFSGRPMLGDRYRRTNATFRKSGTKLVHPNARPPFGWDSERFTCWSKLPEWRRAAYRVGTLCLPLVALGLYLVYAGR